VSAVVGDRNTAYVYSTILSAPVERAAYARRRLPGWMPTGHSPRSSPKLGSKILRFVGPPQARPFMNEGQIRDAVIAKVAKTAAGADAAFISEMFVDSFARRADLVVANGKLAVFEIKSHRDSLERLDGQLASYSRFFEQVTVVCAERHVAAVEASAPAYVGIWSIGNDGGIETIRPPRPIAQESIDSWLSFLPVDELRVMLREFGMLSSGRRDELLVHASCLSLRRVRGYVLSYMKRREVRIARRLERASLKPGAPAMQTPPHDHLQRYLQSRRSEAVTAIPRLIDHSSKKSSASALPLPSGSRSLRAKRVEKSN